MLLIVLSVYLRVELLGHRVTLCLTFCGIARLFYKVVTLFAFLLTVCEGSNITIKLIISVVCYRHPSGHEVVLICISLLMMLKIFSCVSLYIFLEKFRFKFFAQFLVELSFNIEL